MSIVIVLDYALDFVGGAQTAARTQALALAAVGEHVVMVAQTSAAESARLSSHGITVVAPPPTLRVPVVRLPLYRRTARLDRTLEDILVSADATAVIVHSELALAATAIAAARRRGIPSLHVVHTFFWSAPRWTDVGANAIRAHHAFATSIPPARRLTGIPAMDAALREMTLSVALQADVVISPSTHQAAALAAAGVESVIVISNTVPRQRAQSVSVARDPTFAWVGRFAPEKRLDIALDAMRLIHAASPKAGIRLEVAGGVGPAVPGVTYLGVCTADEVAAVFSRSRAALITSIGFDNQPMVALEAFAHVHAAHILRAIRRASDEGCRPEEALQLAEEFG